MSNPEMKSSPEGKEQRMAEIESQLDSLKQELEQLRGTYQKNDLLNGTIRSQSVQHTEIDNLYGWNNGKPITKGEVVDVVNKLREPYNTDISNFIKNKNIMGLQKYLNQKIKDGKIDKTGLAAALKSKRIRFNGSISEDGKFGPQTLETIKFILNSEELNRLEETEKPREPDKPQDPETAREQKEELKGNLDWIIQEMADEISGVVDTVPSKRWSAERLVLDTENFKVDTNNKTITIKTRGTSLNDPERAHNSNGLHDKFLRMSEIGDIRYL